MPLYEYQCRACGHRFEKIRKFSDPPLAECPECGGAVEKLVSAPAIQFKGEGWYITDYARKGSSDKAPADGATASSSSEGGSASKPDSSKSDSSKAGSSTSESTSGPDAKTKSTKSESKPTSSASKD